MGCSTELSQIVIIDRCAATIAKRIDEGAYAGSLLLIQAPRGKNCNGLSLAARLGSCFLETWRDLPEFTK